VKEINDKKYETVMDRENRMCNECQHCGREKKTLDESQTPVFLIERKYRCYKLSGEMFFQPSSTDLPQHLCKDCKWFIVRD
jgi:hypothetical protein